MSKPRENKHQEAFSTLERRGGRVPTLPPSKFHSKSPGVTFRKDRKTKPWRARIQVGNETYYLGCYATEKEAAKVAADAYEKIYGRAPRKQSK